MADFVQLEDPQKLNLARYERVWWDLVHQHFVVMINGTFQAVSASPMQLPVASAAATAGVSSAPQIAGPFHRLSKPFAVKEGKNATLAKFSLDMKLLAIQVIDFGRCICRNL